MNTYDPAEGIVYRHMAGRTDDPATSVDATSVVDRLPTGYANRSPSTRLPAGDGSTAAAA